MDTYLVTGAAGFIGANYVHWLAEQEPTAAWWEHILAAKGDLQIHWGTVL